MLSKVYSGTVRGIDGCIITVEVDISSGLPSLSTVGLPDASVKEARDRVVAALRNSGFDFPVKKITVNLAPAHIKKEGPAFDLPIAVGILAASERVRDTLLQSWCLTGELALDGSVRPVKGILPLALEARSKKLRGIVLPESNVREACVVKGLKIFGAGALSDVVDFLNGEATALESGRCPQGPARSQDHNGNDFSDVKGQRFAKRALEIASAGGHNVLMIGPPGSGKSMLSKRIPSILPPLTLEESIETTKIHSVAGLTGRDPGLVTERPFRNPHHTISDIALIGGGKNPRPGEVSLAHNGVLFLDELPEFHRNVLEVLRQPLEAREVTVARAKETLSFPANFMLVAAMNPCPCGFRGHPARECVCAPFQVQKYMAKISGPLLDRMDIHLEVPALKIDELTTDSEPQEHSDEIRKRVLKARVIQKNRFGESKASAHRRPLHANAQMNSKQTKNFCPLDPEGKSLLRSAIEKLGLSARAYDRILKVARTIADLEGQPHIRRTHLAEAIQYRSLDRMQN